MAKASESLSNILLLLIGSDTLAPKRAAGLFDCQPVRVRSSGEEAASICRVKGFFGRDLPRSRRISPLSAVPYRVTDSAREDAPYDFQQLNAASCHAHRLNYSSCAAPVTQIQVVRFLLQTQKLKPRRGVRDELYALNNSRPNCVGRTASDLGRKRQKKLIHSVGC